MRVSREELQRRTDQLKKICRRVGVRLTHQRIEIFREVARSADHPDAETVYRGVRRRLPTVSLDTVYRTLWLLRDLGLMTALGPPWGRARFDANMRQHHHFVCTQCGATRDLCSRELDGLKAPDEVKEIGTVAAILVEMRGTCLRCARAKSSESVTSATRRQPWRRD
jgi:Fur family peroxide stress response transcriptional regulator